MHYKRMLLTTYTNFLAYFIDSRKIMVKMMVVGMAQTVRRVERQTTKREGREISFCAKEIPEDCVRCSSCRSLAGDASAILGRALDGGGTRRSRGCGILSPFVYR